MAGGGSAKRSGKRFIHKYIYMSTHILTNIYLYIHIYLHNIVELDLRFSCGFLQYVFGIFGDILM